MRSRGKRPKSSSVRVVITDTGTEYEVAVSAGFLLGKTKPLIVHTTEGLGRHIIQWLTDEHRMRDYGVDTIYTTAYPRRDPACTVCRGNTILSGAARPEGICANCKGAGALFPGFAD